MRQFASPLATEALTSLGQPAHNPPRAQHPLQKKTAGGVSFVASKSNAVHQAIADVRAKAKELRESFGAEGRARSLEWAAAKIEQALRDENDDLLTLPQAAELSGYHPDSLARMVRDGQIPDLRPPNSKAMIRIRRGDLPIKPGQTHTPEADVRELASRLLKRGKEGRYGHS